MLAMALLLHGGLLGGMGGEAAGVDGAAEGAWTLATPAEGFLATSGAGELAHLLHLCLFRAFPRGASLGPAPTVMQKPLLKQRSELAYLKENPS